MNKLLIPFAMLGILALAACPPDGNDDDDDVVTDAGIDAGDGCNRPNGAARAVPCSTDEDCRCGLSCLKMQGMASGICMERCVAGDDCETPTPACGVGSIVDIHQDYGVPTFSDNMCVGELGQYADCFTALSRCSVEFECSPSVSDDNDGNEIPDFYHCQEPCELGIEGGCSDDEQLCVPNNAGFYQIEVDDPINPTAQITCTPAECPGDNCECSDTYNCIAFTSGDLCGKMIGMCGQTADIIPVEVLAGGSIPGEYICDSSMGVGCDMTLGGIENPAQVQCITDIFASDPSMGICISICGEPDDQGVYSYTNCPEGMECLTEGSWFVSIIQENGANKTCEDDDDCAAYPGSECGEYTSGTFCGRPYGMCGSPLVVEDGGVPEDAGTMEDAAATDARAPEDAAAATDAGVVEDAGTVEDATVTEDAATTPDSAVEDSAVEDSAVEDSAVEDSN